MLSKRRGAQDTKGCRYLTGYHLPGWETYREDYYSIAGRPAKTGQITDLEGFKNLRGLETAYQPTVSVGTKRMGEKVLISVKDNGNGIPPKVLDKIFQPFFTTKPTGQGTGLGLSLSYDIVKAHSGELSVETKEGGGTEMIVAIPI